MTLPQDGQNANDLTKVTQIPAGKELMFIDPTTNEGGIITLEDLTKQILNGLTSQAFALDAGQMTLPAALNYLYGKLFMEIPVAITIENKTLNAKLSISDTDYGLICLTYQISAFVYAIALIVYGSKYSSKILSFVSSNAKTNEAKWDSNSKTFTCTIDTNNTNVVNARAILIK